MKTTLYNIESDYLNLIERIQEMEGEITPEIEEQLIINENQLESKSIAYLEVITSSENYIKSIDDEIKRLQVLKKKSNNLVDKLKNRLLEAVKIFGAFEVGFTKFGTRKSSSIEVEDVNELPKEYKVIKVTEQADKKKLKEAIKNGEEIKGVELKENINLKIN